jgi:hypothetical protein
MFAEQGGSAVSCVSQMHARLRALLKEWQERGARRDLLSATLKA